MTLPPGRPRQARDEPNSDGSARRREHDRDDCCRLLRRHHCWGSRATMTSTFGPHQLGRDLGHALDSRPSAQRYSIAMVRPSVQPSSRNRCIKAAIHVAAAGRVVAPGIRRSAVLLGSARDAIGQCHAAPPSSVMNSRLSVDRIASVPASQTGSISYPNWRAPSGGKRAISQPANRLRPVRVIRVDSAMSELRPLIPRKRPKSGHLGKSESWQEVT